MNSHDEQIYRWMIDYLKDIGQTQINVNVAEYVARYHVCDICNKIVDRKQIYEELKKYFIKENINIILQLISAVPKQGGITYKKWIPYLAAAKHAVRKAGGASQILAKAIE